MTAEVVKSKRPCKEGDYIVSFTDPTRAHAEKGVVKFVQWDAALPWLLKWSTSVRMQSMPFAIPNYCH